MRAKEFLTEYKSEAAINTIINTYGSKLEQKLLQDLQVQQNKDIIGDKVDVRKLIDFFIKIDPTQKSIYVNWLINRYLEGFIYLEDASKATDLLSFYEKAKAKLPQEQRDISYFKSLRQLADLIISMKGQNIDTTSNREKERQLEKEMLDKGEIKIYYDSSELKIIIIKSERASCYYGRNTKWCTSAVISRNQFDLYRKGTLYILLFKKQNIRWQFYFESFEFNDDKNENLSAVKVKSVGHLFPGTYIDPNISEEEQLAWVKRNGHVIDFMKNPSEKVQLEAVRNAGAAIQYIKNPSEKLKLLSVKKNPDSIKYIKNPSEEIQIAAVGKDGYTIQYIKNPSEKVQIAAINNTPHAIRTIKNPPPSYEMQMYAVKKKGDVIQYIKNPSEEMQIEAVKQDKKAIKYIKKPTPAVKTFVGNK
jgi:hypothetical protein